MKNMMLALIALIALSSCATKVLRTPENDAMQRILIDPAIPVEHYTEIKAALVESGKFEIVDRTDGFEAMVREQELEFRSKHSNRFSEREKYMHIGRAYGARGIVTARASCFQRTNFWGKFVKTCKQTLFFVDGYTGKVEFAVRGENSEEWVVGYTVPDWNDVVERAIGEYPKYFKPIKEDRILKAYKDQSEELSRRERLAASTSKPTIQPLEKTELGEDHGE